MRLNSNAVKSIKNKETTFVKKFTTIFKIGKSEDILPTSQVSPQENEYDFNFISKHVDECSSCVWTKKDEGFSSIWQVRHVHSHDPFFFTLFDFFKKTFTTLLPTIHIVIKLKYIMMYDKSVTDFYWTFICYR